MDLWMRVNLLGVIAVYAAGVWIGSLVYASTGGWLCAIGAGFTAVVFIAPLSFFGLGWLQYQLSQPD